MPNVNRLIVDISDSDDAHLYRAGLRKEAVTGLLAHPRKRLPQLLHVGENVTSHGARKTVACVRHNADKVVF